jgi:hypothetical protein
VVVALEMQLADQLAALGALQLAALVARLAQMLEAQALPTQVAVAAAAVQTALGNQEPEVMAALVL